MADSKPLLPSEANAAEDQRVAARESIFLGAKVAHAGKIVDGRIRNISTTGAYLEANTDLQSGDRISITFRGFENVSATITRTTARGVGVRFHDPIDPSQCRWLPSSPGQLPHFQPVRYVAPVVTPKRPARRRLFDAPAPGGGR